MTVRISAAESLMPGYRPVRIPGITAHSNRIRNSPWWVQETGIINVILGRAFPKLRSDPVQRERAALWRRIIQQYYREGKTRKQVAERLEISENLTRYYIRGIRLVAEGKTVDGEPRGLRRRGRPKIANKYPTPRTTLER